jgi:hypothetical protein
MSDQVGGLFFGGWGNYKLWEENGFLPKPPDATQAVAVPAPEPPPPPEPTPEPPPPPEPEEDQVLPPVDWDQGRPIVRPYTRTGGRTHAAHQLELETLLSVPRHLYIDLSALRSDHRAICEACRTPQSTAEVSVHLGLPLGAARVLIADTVDMGLLTIHENALTEGARPSLGMMERVLDGLRALG